MYDSGLSDWTVVKMGPKRDTLGETGDRNSRTGFAFRTQLASRRAQLLL